MEPTDVLPPRAGESGATAGGATPADLFTPPFVRQHTDAATLAAFLEASPLAGDGDASREEFDAYVAAHSEFDSWEEMETAAEVALLEREIGLL